MAQKTHLAFIVQEHTCCGWEDVGEYDCGERQCDYRSAKKEAYDEAKTYCENGYPARVITRRVPVE